jgi:Inactivated superfamily I helicase
MEKKKIPLYLLDSLIELLKFVAYKIQTNPTANDFLLNQVSETGKVVNRLKNILSRYQHYVRGIDELEVLFQLINHNIAIKLNGKATEGLQLMGILETRNLDFDNFYMIGVNEGVLPTDKSNGSFIPYPIRKECGLPDYKKNKLSMPIISIDCCSTHRRCISYTTPTATKAAANPAVF